MEKEKLFLVKKYQYLFELIFVPVFFSGIYMRFNIMEGNTFLIASSMLFLAFSYFLQARYIRTEFELPVLDRLFQVIVFYSLAISLVGVLFKLQMWDNSKVLLLTGIAGLALGLIYMIKIFIKTPSKELIFTFIRGVVVLALTNFIYTTTEGDMVHTIYKKDPEFIRLYDRVQEFPMNKVYKEHYMLYKKDGKH